VSIESERIFGRYEIVRPIGEGGMGTIYLARQAGLAGFDRFVTLKSILPQLAKDPEVLDSFLDEARVVSAVNHPHVVAVYETGEWKGTYFMAMEYVDGVDLDEVASAARAADAPPTPRFVASVGRDAALALDSAHHATDMSGNPLQIVHRDVTPHNIMLRRDGMLKLLDFGVAQAAGKKQKTQQGVLKGKLGYFSPEQCGGDDVDGRSDQFVLGVVLWELLTGERAYPGDNPLKVMSQIAMQRLPPPSSRALVPPALDAIVHRMTEPDPEARFPRCNDVADALRGFLQTAPGDENEVAQTVRRHCGAKLDERARQLLAAPSDSGASAAAPAAPTPQPLPIDVGELGLVELPAAAPPQPSAAPWPAPAPASPDAFELEPSMRPERQKAITSSFSSMIPPVAGANVPLPRPEPRKPSSANGSSFLEFELDLDDGSAPLELVEREGSDSRGGDAISGEATSDARRFFEEALAYEDDEVSEVDDLSAPVEEASRDEVTVVWCLLEGVQEAGLSAERRQELNRQLEESAAAVKARFSIVGDEGIVAILGADKADNDAPRLGVRLATELVALCADQVGQTETLRVRAGVATGASPPRDSNGASSPTIKDEAVDRARRLAHAAAAGRVMVSQETQRLSGRRVRYDPALRTIADQWNTPFVASEIAGYGAPPATTEIQGRSREVERVRSVVERAARRRSAGLTLVSAGGRGKTTLLGEAERVARWKGMVVARATCGRVLVPIAYDGIRQLLRSAAADVVELLGDEEQVLKDSSAFDAACRLLGLPRAFARRLEALAGGRRRERGVPLERRQALARAAVISFFRTVAEQGVPGAAAAAGARGHRARSHRAHRSTSRGRRPASRRRAAHRRPRGGLAPDGAPVAAHRLRERGARGDRDRLGPAGRPAPPSEHSRSRRGRGCVDDAPLLVDAHLPSAGRALRLGRAHPTLPSRTRPGPRAHRHDAARGPGRRAHRRR
jgi:serine/threonine protein kinase